ncbi:hypothetical protein TNIN_16921 [Trichonephila inaurata madagascariensis]|uniref:Uncharacterized protein n=1 Tax=Trichonephila inaurata madagascariensis TaxID=2747483 RepID=A0A8X6Y3D3_9ARAC|nr:hypothetical protein TNIN_16921 [Trichonephila inaurata madagascariensis]
MLDGLPRNSPRPSDPSLTPYFAGNDTSRKVSFLPPFCSSDISLSNTLARTLVLLTCTLRFRRGRGCAWDIRHTLNPFTGHRKGVSPVRERPLKLIAEVAYIKVAPVSGCVR